MNTRFGRENIGYFWIVGEPILFCGGVAIAWTAMRPSFDHGLQTTAIVITGYVPLTMWRHSIGRAVKAFESNGSLLFHRQVTPLDIIISRWVLEAVGTTAAGILVAVAAILTGFMSVPDDIGLVYLGIFYQALFCFASALIIAALSEVSEIVEKFMTVLLYLSLPFSGAFVMVSWVPKSFQSILLWSPSVHNVEMIRAGQFGPGAHAQYDIFYDSWITGLLMLLGLSLTLRVRRHITIQ